MKKYKFFYNKSLNARTSKEIEAIDFPEAYKLFWKFIRTLKRHSKPYQILEVYEVSETVKLKPISLTDYTDEQLGLNN